MTDVRGKTARCDSADWNVIADWDEAAVIHARWLGCYSLHLVGTDPCEIERHFAEQGDTPVEQHYKRRMFELVRENARLGIFGFSAFYRDNNLPVFVFNGIFGGPTWVRRLEEWRALVCKLAREDPELRALALEMRHLRGTDELTFEFDATTNGMRQKLPMTVSVFGGAGKNLEI